MSGPLAGPLFENFCVQEAVKAMLAEGVSPRLFYLRTPNGLEVDLLAEGANWAAAALSSSSWRRRPGRRWAARCPRFREAFEPLEPEPGGLVTLSEQAGPLMRNVQVDAVLSTSSPKFAGWLMFNESNTVEQMILDAVARRGTAGPSRRARGLPGWGLPSARPAPARLGVPARRPAPAPDRRRDGGAVGAARRSSGSTPRSPPSPTAPTR